MSAYYNENDRFPAEWLRELMKEGVIAPGEVDERDIREVESADLRGFTQCHFFAGVGVWSYALRGAGWRDTEPVWTGSCPCQPFSSAGKRMGTDDVRHLWPEWWRLIRGAGECRPPVIFGEQVASPDGLAWLDIVLADLEGAGYAVAPFDLCAAGFGAPHIRQRLYFVADSRYGAESHRQQVGKASGSLQGKMGKQRVRVDDSDGGNAGNLADTESARRGVRNTHDVGPANREIYPLGDNCKDDSMVNTDGSTRHEGMPRAGERGTERRGTTGELGNAGRQRLQERERHGEVQREAMEPQEGEAFERRGFTSGFWGDAEWIWCKDGKYRPVEPGTFPLAHGAPARVGRLRGYGNAINKEVAEGFIKAYLEAKCAGGV